MALGDFVKKIFVKIKVDGAEEAFREMAAISAQADKLKDGVTIPVKVDRDGMTALKGLQTELARLREPKVSKDLQDLAARFHMLALTTDDARVRTRALAGELDALGKTAEKGWISKLLGGTTSLPGPLPAVPTPVAIAGIVAALAALPFIAQAAAGAIVLGLGGALTGLGVYAEMGVRSVKYQFSQLVGGKDGISATLKNLSPAFGQALTTILSAARTFVPQFIRDFKPALDAIAGPLKSLGVMIAGTLASPQVRTSIFEMGRAFGSVLKALTPMVPGMFTAIADGFTNVARAISRNPKPIADLIAGLAHLIGILLDVIAWLTNVATYIEQHWIPAWQRTIRFLDSWRHAIASTMEGYYHDALSIFNRAQAAVVSIWDATWNRTVGATIRGVSSVVGWFRRLPGMIMSALAALPGMLYSAGQHAVQSLISGLGSLMGQLSSMASSLASKVAGFFGLSPAKEGPLSGSGAPEIRGAHFALDFARGMDRGGAQVAAAAMRLAGSANPGGVMGAYPGIYPGGVLHLEVTGGGGGMLDRLFISWLKNYVRVAGGGGPQSVQRALGQVWR